MKSRYEISMDYQRVLSMTNELDELASTLRKETKQNGANTLRTLGAGWSGENAQQFISKANSFLDKTEETASYLNSMASQIRANARRVYLAELEALRIAQQRNYN